MPTKKEDHVHRSQTQRRKDIRDKVHEREETRKKPAGDFKLFNALGLSVPSKQNPNDHLGKLSKDGEFRTKSNGSRPSFTEHTSKQSNKNGLDLVSRQELDAAIKLGRFVTVRKRLRAIAAQRRKVQDYIRNIVIFTIFLIVFVLRNSSSDEDLYYSTRAVSEIFVAPLDYGEIATAGNMWDWIEGTLCNNYYGQGTFDGIDNIDRERWLFGTYRKVGGVRIATLRVKKKSCGIQSKLFNSSDNEKLICYGFGDKNTWDLSVEDQQDYGLDPSNQFEWKGWNGTNAAKRRTEYFTQIQTYPNSHSYKSPSFGFVLPQMDKKQALMSVGFAKNNGYVDFHTRMVMVDMTLMNGQTSNLMTLRFMFAMSKAGGVIPTYEFVQVETEAIDFLTTNFSEMESSTVWMMLEIIFYIYFFIQLIIKMIMDQCKGADPLEHGKNISCLASNFLYRPYHYYQALSNDLPDFFQTLNVFFYCAHWYFRIRAWTISPRDITFDTDEYIPLRTYTETLSYKRYPMVGVTFCVFFRYIFYIGIVPEFGVITKALTKSIRSIAGFMGVFVFFIVMFVFAGLQLFGTKMEGFRSFPAAFWMVFELGILGESAIEDMLSADRNIVTNVYIFLFYILLTVMLLNMAIAIISDAYAESRAEVDEGLDTDVKIGREVKRYFMLKIWKIPFLGPYIKNRYINYGEIQQKKIRRAISGDMSLHQQIKLQQMKMKHAEKENTMKKTIKSSSRNVTNHYGSAGSTHNLKEHDTDHLSRMTKTAAQQTLKELRQLSGRIDFLINNIDNVGGGSGGVEDFLFAHKKQNKSFGTAKPSFVLDGISARNHAVVEMVEVDNNSKKMPQEIKKNKEHGVL